MTMTQAAAATPKTPAAIKPEEDFDAAFERMGREAASPQDAEDPNALPAEGPKAAAADDDAAAVPATAEDLWAGLTDKQKAALGDLNQRLATADHRIASDDGRVLAFQRKIDELTRASRPAAGQPAAGAPSTQLTEAALAGDPAAWKQLEEDYPTIAKPIREMAARTAATIQQVREQVRAEVQQTVQPLLKRFEADDENRQQSFMNKQVEDLTKAHQDWQTVKASKEFGDWIAGQPPGVQGMIRSQDARDAIHVLDLYKDGQNSDTESELTAKRELRRQQAAAVPGMSGRAAQQSRQQQIPDDFDAAWDEFGRRSAPVKK